MPDEVADFADTIETAIQGFPPRNVDVGWPMQGPSGRETLLPLARETPLPDDTDLKQLLADLPRRTMQQPKSLAQFVGSLTAGPRLVWTQAGARVALPARSRRHSVEYLTGISGTDFSMNRAASFEHREEDPE